MKYIASTQASVKLNNQRLILELLIHEGPMSRADIAKRIHSSKPTVSKNVDLLFQEEKLIEVGKSDNLVGKKGILLDVNADYKHVLTIDLSKNRFRMLVADLRHHWIDFKEYNIEEALDQAEVLLESFIENSSIDVSKIGQIVIAYPGVVGHNDHYYLTNHKNKEILLDQIKPYLKQHFNIPLLVKNDLNLSVLTEKYFGKAADASNICLVSGDVGVGLGIIINHELYEGDRNAAGEIGFVLPVQHKDGRYYTLEERIGINALIKRYQTLTDYNIDFIKLQDLVNHGDKQATEIYESVIEDLSVAISNVASILDIKTIIGTGRLFKLKVNMYDDLNAVISKMTPFDTAIYESSIDQKAIKGAVIVGVDEIIKRMVSD